MIACLFQAANRSPFFTVLSDVSPNLLQGVCLNIPGIKKSGGKRESCDAHYIPGSARLSPGRKEGMEQGLSCIHIVKFSRLECKKSIRFC